MIFRISWAADLCRLGTVCFRSGVFWQRISKLRTTLYWNHIAPHRQGSAAHKIPYHWISPTINPVGPKNLFWPTYAILKIVGNYFYIDTSSLSIYDRFLISCHKAQLLYFDQNRALLQEECWIPIWCTCSPMLYYRLQAKNRLRH